MPFQWLCFPISLFLIRFYQGLVANISFKYKEVHAAAAEVIGMILKYLSENDKVRWLLERSQTSMTDGKNLRFFLFFLLAFFLLFLLTFFPSFSLLTFQLPSFCFIPTLCLFLPFAIDATTFVLDFPATFWNVKVNSFSELFQQTSKAWRPLILLFLKGFSRFIKLTG